MTKGRAKPIKRKPLPVYVPYPYWRSPIRNWLLSFGLPNGERYRIGFEGTYSEAVQERDARLRSDRYVDCWMIDTGKDKIKVEL